MADYDSCPNPDCRRGAEDNVLSNYFSVYTCLECDIKYCEYCARDGNCPKCGSSDYGEYDKVYA